MKKLFIVIALSALCNYSLAQIITTIAGNGICISTGDGGSATAASMRWPHGIVIDSFNNIYYLEQISYVVRKIDASGIISRYAGNGTGGYSGDGGPATSAQIRPAEGLALDGSGNLYIAEAGKIRKVSPTGIITTVAGGDASLSGGDGGLATVAHVVSLGGVCVDGAGNLYFTEENSIRKVNSSGIISTIAGNDSAGYTGDGGLASAARLYMPRDLKIDTTGNIYIVETGNNVIRKINTAGIITTIAGNGSSGYSGDGGPATTAQLAQPNGIAIDRTGNIYIGDASNNVIRKVNTAGIISTVVGNTIGDHSGDGGPATAASIYHPTKLAFDSHDNLYISANGEYRIRRVSNALLSTANPTGNAGNSLSIVPNPSSGNFTFKLFTNNSQETNVRISDLTGRKLKEFTTSTNTLTKLNIDLPDGIYILSAKTGDDILTEKIVISTR